MSPKALLLLLILTGISTVLTTEPITIFICGDSTAAKYDTKKTKIQRGWGQMFQNFFNEAYVKIDNHAIGGRSSKSFIVQGFWDKVKNLIKKGDYVIIQFGHNDESNIEERHTDPGSTFDQYLTQYVIETQKLGGIPVLMSPVARRKWVNGKFVDQHKEYREVPKRLAESLGVHFVNANSFSEQLEIELGEEGSKKLHLIFEPGVEEEYPNGVNDNTHYSVYGATTVAGLIAEGLVEEIPELKDYYKY